ncbi:MAG: hypothetical protein Aurels2KO_08070 [Aureliella sp.]
MSASINIEAIVEAVVARLQQQRNPSADIAPRNSSETGCASDNDSAAQQLEAAAGVKEIDQPVVALEHLRGLLDDATTVTVRSNAVVTPAVMDELRSKNIKLQRKQAIGTANSSAKKILVLANGQLASVISRSRQLENCETVAIGDQTAQATRAATERIQRDSSARIVWQTPKPFAASLVSQGPGKTRAVQLNHPGQLQQAIQEASPNLLILDSAVWTDSAVVRLLSQWSQVPA